jgi:hypothetical protein
LPRYCYKFNRSQRLIYNSEAHKFGSESMSSGRKFSSLNPTQNFPSFSAHLADCLLNPTIEQSLGTNELQLRHLDL